MTTTDHAAALPRDLVAMLRERAQAQPDTQAGVYLGDGEDVRAELSFAELDEGARALAARLQGLSATGRHAILLYPPGLDFLIGFFGCLYAGVVAVPLPVPRANASLTQFRGILSDLHTDIVLTNAATLSRLQRLEILGFDQLICLTSEQTSLDLARAWRSPAIDREAVAYLQYTSGSTSDRKGVMISHANVIANLQGIAARFRHHAQSVCVNWLPHFHDLGLVSGMLQPIFHGHLNVMMSPTAFVQQPVRWLNAISRFRGTYSNSPNFGYDLCVRRVTAEQREMLDLSSWQVALNGAEPVRRQTLDEFCAMFVPCGFTPAAMLPAYGLAEATLVVSAGFRQAAPVELRLDSVQLERNRVVSSDAPDARSIVGCGLALDGTSIAIMDPASSARCGDDSVGEIWVRGPAVSVGYWQNLGATSSTFGATPTDEEPARYLRTGDLGFVRDGELYVTGRLKDLIIIRGSNYYPQDIEWTIEQCHPAFRQGCGAAFAVETQTGENLVVAIEVERDFLRNLATDDIARLARRAVAEQHELTLHELVLLRTGTVPRTSSGKIQRGQCRREYLSDELDVVARSSAAPSVPTTDHRSYSPPTTAQRSADDILAWLRDYADSRLNSALMDERRSIAPPVLLDFGNHGVLGLQVPAALGGCGFGYYDSLRVIQQLGAIDQTLAMMTIVHNTLGIRPIMYSAQSALRAELLPALASGRQLAAFAITEPGAGSNPQAMAAHAQPDGAGGWLLDGQKSWSGSAGWASVINIFVRNLGADGRAQGISGFCLPRGTRGLRVGAEAMTFGMRGMVQNAIHLDGARVLPMQLLGDVGSGMKVAQDAMMQGRLNIAAACIGGMKRCVQLALRYAGRRTIVTGRLLDNPTLLSRFGEISGAIAALEHLLDHITRRLDAGVDVTQDAYIVCKIAGPEWLWRAADDLVQFLGGRGYIENNGAAQLLRDARVTRILEGPTEALSAYLGSRVINDGEDLRRFIALDLGAPAIAKRLTDISNEVHARCLANDHRFGRPPAASRWAYALIGQLATDAVLLAALAQEEHGHYRAWAEQHFENSLAKALTESGGTGFALRGTALADIVAGYVGAVGDVEQSQAGEDWTRDELLNRTELTSNSIGPVGGGDTASGVPQRPLLANGIQPPKAQQRLDESNIESFIFDWLAKELRLPERGFDASREFFDYGVDSVTAINLVVILEERLGRDLDPESVYQFPVIRDFIRHILTTS